MDAYKISQSTWGRLDFPYEKFFSNKVDESILDWKPTRAEPKMTDEPPLKYFIKEDDIMAISGVTDYTNTYAADTR